MPSYKAFVVSVEMVECELQIGSGEGALLVYGGCEELRVVDRAVFVEVKPLEYLVDVLCVNVCYVTVVRVSLSNLV